jgi:hypothetical protein
MNSFSSTFAALAITSVGLLSACGSMTYSGVPVSADSGWSRPDYSWHVAMPSMPSSSMMLQPPPDLLTPRPPVTPPIQLRMISPGVFGDPTWP